MILIKTFPYFLMRIKKKRYIAIDIKQFPNSISKEYLEGYLTKCIKRQYGNYGLSLIDILEVDEIFTEMKIAIIKCNIETFQNVLFVLKNADESLISSINIPIVHYFPVLCVSGILKKLKSKILAMNKI